MGGREKRRDPRYPVSLPAKLTCGKDTFELRTHDVSFRGLFIRTDTPPPLRDLVKIQLEMPPEGERIDLLGMAVYVVNPETAGGRMPGVGVQFFGIGPEIRARWERFVQQVRQGLPQDPVAPVAEAKIPHTLHGNPQYRDYRPEFRVRPKSAEELLLIYNRHVLNNQLLLTTEVHLDPGTNLNMVVIHPTTDKVFTFTGVVRDRVDTSPTSTCLIIDLTDLGDERKEAFSEFVDDNIFITIDMDVGFIDQEELDRLVVARSI